MREPDVLVKFVDLDRNIDYYGYYDPSEKVSPCLQVLLIHEVKMAEEAERAEQEAKSGFPIFFTSEMMGDFIKIQHLVPETSANWETICHCGYCLNKHK